MRLLGFCSLTAEGCTSPTKQKATVVTVTPLKCSSLPNWSGLLLLQTLPVVSALLANVTKNVGWSEGEKKHFMIVMCYLKNVVFMHFHAGSLKQKQFQTKLTLLYIPEICYKQQEWMNVHSAHYVCPCVRYLNKRADWSALGCFSTWIRVYLVCRVFSASTSSLAVLIIRLESYLFPSSGYKSVSKWEVQYEQNPFCWAYLLQYK